MTLQESIYSLGEMISSNLEEKGVDVDSDDGLTTMANKVLDIVPPEGNIIQLSVIFDDEDDNDRIRPSEIKIKLTSCNFYIYITEDQNWQTTLNTVCSTNNLQPVEPEGYTLIDIVDSSYVYYHYPETVSKGIRIIWDDNNNSYHKRPQSVYFELSDNLTTETNGITLDSSKNWSWSFEPLWKYKDGQEKVYSWDIPNVSQYKTEDITDSGEWTVVTYKLLRLINQTENKEIID